MTGQQLEQIKKKTLSDKLLIMAETLKNCNLTQCRARMYNKIEDAFCALGALAFMAGIPKNDIPSLSLENILGNYLTSDESNMDVKLPTHIDHLPSKVTLRQSIYTLNDQGWTFKELGFFLEDLANDQKVK